MANQIFTTIAEEISSVTQYMENLKNSMASTQDKEKEIKTKISDIERKLKNYNHLACQIMEIMEESCEELKISPGNG